ncbi:MAG: protein kinase [Cyanobacteriota bacterium]|nr:protein kinase [Cyanobacteriota bacterium]
MHPQEQDTWLGKTIGDDQRYLLDALLGQGGMGRVFKAIDQRLSTPEKLVYCAVKFILVDLGSDAGVKLRFQREMQTCALLRHPYIVEALDCGVIPMMVASQRKEFPFLVMELVDGSTLSQVLKQERRLDPRRAVKIARQVTQALQAVHKGVILDGKIMRFIHRDLKPANVFLLHPQTPQETVKLGDFGLVKAIGESGDQNLTRTGTFAGSPEYCSPEQFEEFKDVDARADIYSLGCILYRMVSGTNLFNLPGKLSFSEWVTAHYEHPVAPFRPELGIPEALQAVIFRCLEKDPEQRYASAQALDQALAVIAPTLTAATSPAPRTFAGDPSLNLTSLPTQTAPALDEIGEMLNRYYQSRSLTVQIKQQGSELGILINRPDEDPLDYPTLTTEISQHLATLNLEHIEKVKLFSRPQGRHQPDWQTQISLNALHPSSTLPQPRASDPESLTSKSSQTLESATDKDSFKLSDYCFVRNRLLLTTSLPDPEAEVGQAIRFFHELSLADQKITLEALTHFFKNLHQHKPEAESSYRLHLSLLLQQWLEGLEKLNERQLQSVAIWLSRYCLDPEKVLPRVTASFLAATEAAELAKQDPKLVGRKSQHPQKLKPEKVIYYARSHWIIFIWPTLLACLQLLVAYLELNLTPVVLLAWLDVMLSPTFLALFVILPILLYRAIGSVFKLIALLDPVKWLRTYPIAIVSTLVVIFLGFLPAFSVPPMWVWPIILILIFVAFILQFYQSSCAYNRSIMALTDQGRILIKSGEITPQDLINPQLESFRADEITEIKISQGSWQKLADFGSVRIMAEMRSSLTLYAVANPQQFKLTYQKQIAKLRQEKQNLQISQTIQRDPWINREIGVSNRYRLDSLIGTGGMGKVYKAFDQELYLTVAVKFMMIDGQRDPESLGRFDREMKASIYLQNDRVVKILNSGLMTHPETGQGSLPFLVMEYMAAPTLAQVLQQQPKFPVARTLHLINEMALALQTLHQGVNFQGKHFTFVHRDLKPANIFLLSTSEEKESIKLADFGLVKIQGSRQLEDNPDDQGRFMGTARYAAPEQCQGREEIDGRADIYSLGVIFYEMLSGTNPFGLTSQANATQYLFSHLQKQPIPFPTYLKIPASVTAIVMRCLKKNPQERYSSGSQLSADLQTCLTNLGG